MPSTTLTVLSAVSRELTARLEVEGWLDPDGADVEHGRAREIHRDLIAVARGQTTTQNGIDAAPSSLVARINQHAEALLGEAIEALCVLQDREVEFAMEVPGEGSGASGWVVGTFSDVGGGDPLESLRLTSLLRSVSPAIQVRALELDQALRVEEDASRSLASAHLDALFQSGGWPGGVTQGDVPGLPVGEALTRKRAAKLTMDELESRARAASALALRTAQRRAAALKKRVPESSWMTCRDIGRWMEFNGDGSGPVAVVLPVDIEQADCALVARAYENLANTLRGMNGWVIRGPRRQSAEQARIELMRSRRSLLVLAGWIRSLGGLQASPLCEFCYRHRATKKRCPEHGVQDFLTSDARLAQAIRPGYVKFFSAVAREAPVRGALQASMAVGQLEWKAVEPEVRARGIPEELIRQVCVLVVQLRRLRSSFGPKLEAEAAKAFQTLLRLATEVHQRPAGRTMAEVEASSEVRARSKALLTLRGFLIAWCATGQPFPLSFPALVGRKHDSAHPIVRDFPLIESAVAAGFLRERAWVEAEAQQRKRTVIDRRKVLRRSAKGMSFDKIAQEFGCSHDTIAKIINRKHKKRRRARLTPFSATPRAKVPGATA